MKPANVVSALFVQHSLRYLPRTSDSLVERVSFYHRFIFQFFDILSGLESAKLNGSETNFLPYIMEPKLFNLGSSSGSTFSFILAPSPALYCYLKNGKNWFDYIRSSYFELSYKSNIIRNVSQLW